MPNRPTVNASYVIVGSARLIVAPTGTTIPVLDGTVQPVTWNAAFEEVGSTEDGTVLNYQATPKEHYVDEQPTPVKVTLDKEVASISANLAEATLENLKAAIAASTLSTGAADATHAGFSKLEVGGGELTEVIVGLEGLNELGRQRIIVGYRAIAFANLKMSFKRNDKLIIPVEFKLQADTSKADGKNLFVVYDDKAEMTA